VGHCDEPHRDCRFALPHASCFFPASDMAYNPSQRPMSTSPAVDPGCSEFCCVACVSTGQMGVVEHLGKFHSLANPGMNCFCYPFKRVAGRLSTRVQQLNVETVTKTKDNVTVTVSIAVQYRVINDYISDIDAQDVESGTESSSNPLSDPSKALAPPNEMDRDDLLQTHGVYRAYYRLTNINQQLTPYVEDVVRSEIPRKSLDEAYTSKQAVAIAVRSALQHEMKRYGYEIVNALVTDLQPDANVLKAMNQIESQRRMRMAAQEKAEAEKILVVKAAEADAEAKELSGQGVARQRKAIVDGLKESVVQFNEGVHGTSPADVMQLMMVTQYLDMLKDVGTQDTATTVFIPHSPAGVNDIQSQMRQGFLEANYASGRGGKKDA